MINLWDYLGGTPKHDPAEVMKSELEETREEIEKLKTSQGQGLKIETEKDGTVQISTQGPEPDPQKEGASQDMVGQLVWLAVFAVIAVLFFIGWSIFVSVRGPAASPTVPTNTDNPTVRSFDVPLNSL